MTGAKAINVEAGDYIEDDPTAWNGWLTTVRRYVPDYQPLVKSVGAVGAAEIVAGTMLSYLADQCGIYLLRGDMERVVAPTDQELEAERDKVRRLVFALSFHNKDADDNEVECLPECLACALIEEMG